MGNIFRELIREQIKEKLDESTKYNKHSFHAVIHNGLGVNSSSDHEEMHSNQKPFDAKFRGRTDKLADHHEKLSMSHTLKHIIANHIGDKKGASLHKKAAKVHNDAYDQINGEYHLDSEHEWNKAQTSHENAMSASKEAEDHDRKSSN